MGMDKLENRRFEQSSVKCFIRLKIGFVFCVPAGRIFTITSFQIRLCADLAGRKLALFFQIISQPQSH
jgi:hypothetical protein